MKILLATVESAEHAVVSRALRLPHILTSYFYNREKNVHPLGESTLCANWTMAHRLARLRFIDSGGYTLRNAMLAGTQGRAGVAVAQDADPDHFLSDYIDWLKVMDRMRLADVWVEVDIGAATGQRWVDAQRERIIAAGLGHGLAQVWHSNEHDWDYWLWMLREACRPGRSRYVAMEGHIPGRDPLPYTRYLREAYRRGVRVHGFHMTDHEDMKRFPFYSVDSSSWNAPVTQGTFVIRTATGALKQAKNPARIKALRPGERLTWRGGHVAKGTSSRYRLDRLFSSARAWLELERNLDAYWRSRGVDWDGALERPEVTE